MSGFPIAARETVEISGGAFHGLQAVVTRDARPATRGRVAGIFGRQTMVEIDEEAVVRDKDERQQILTFP
jgi:hypothetical protein